MLEMQIAVTYLKEALPKGDTPLIDRLKFAMRYANQHEHDIFWMCSEITDDLKFKSALAAVMLTGNEEEKDLINRSVKPLKMLSAAINGVPVDFSQIGDVDELLPLLSMWEDSKTP